MHLNYTTMYKVVAVLLGLCSIPPVLAQYGAVDHSFAPSDDGTYGDGPVKHHEGGGDLLAEIWKARELPDGYILAKGVLLYYNGTSCESLVKLTSDGRLADAGPFDIPSGYSVVTFEGGDAGSLLVSLLGAPSSGRLVRFDATGTLDPDFNVLADHIIRDVEWMADGRILIAGMFDLVNGVGCPGVARLLADGSLDPTFQPGLGADGPVSDLLQMPNGDALVGGSFTSFNGQPRSGLARIHEDGSLDPSFAAVEGASASISTMALDGEGRILVGGGFHGLLGSLSSNLVRFLPDGQLDAAFDPGAGPDDAVYAIHPLEDGNILIGGRFTSVDGEHRPMLTRLLTNGEPDPAFEHILGGTVQRDVRSIDVCGNGELLISGRFNRAADRLRSALVRLHPDGSLVESFNPGRGPGGLLRDMAILAGGRIAIGGDIPSFNDRPRPYLAILDQDGELIPDAIQAGGPNAPVNLLVPLPDGGLFVVGEFMQYDGLPVEGMVYTDENGQLVQSVSPTWRMPGERLSCIVALGDGGMLVATALPNGPWWYTSRLLKLLPDGTLDEAFTPVEDIEGRVEAIAVTGDGRILIAGSFTTVGAFARRGVARLTPAGTVDASFDPGAGIGQVPARGAKAMALLDDGRILIAGRFDSFNGVQVGNIACLDPNGMLDPTFSPTGANDIITSMAAIPGGRFVVAGLFGQFAGAPHGNIAVGLPNGEQDASFLLAGAPEYVNFPRIDKVLLDANGDYLVCGPFHRIGGVVRHRMARLGGGGGLGVNAAGRHAQLQVWPNPTTDMLHLGTSAQGLIMDAHGRMVRKVERTRSLDVSDLAPGHYVFRPTGGFPVPFVKL